MDQQKTRRLFTTLILGLFSAALVYSSFFQRNFFSKTYLVITLGILLCTTVGSFYANRLLLIPFLKSYDRRIIHWIILGAFALSCLLATNLNLKPLYAISPSHTIRVQISPDENPSGQDIYLESLKNALGYIPYNSFKLSGIWQPSEETLNIQTDDDFSLTWSGKTGDFIEIVFQPTTLPAAVDVWIDGQQQVQINLQNNNSALDIAFRHDFLFSKSNLGLVYLAFLAISTYAILLSWCILTKLPATKASSSTSKGWIWYALPMIIIWGTSLLIFWPGMMSTDSIDQWGQALNGEMTNWHSIFHTFLISLLIRVWDSPAFIAIIQILALSIVFARGIGILQRYGAPKGILWVITLIFAFFPPNIILAITLWKDVAYAIALLALFLCILQIALSKAKWLDERYSWVKLSLATFSTAVFRHNGAAVAFGCLVILLLLLQSHRKQLIHSLLTTILLWVCVQVVGNWLSQSSQTSFSQSNLISLSQIAAHVEAGTELENQDRDYLDTVMSLTDWDYDCCYIGTISYNKEFNRDLFLSNTDNNFKIARSLFLRDPQVNIHHQICASNIIWNFVDIRCGFKSMHAFNNFKNGKESWIESNTYGLEERSYLPGLISPYTNFLDRLGFFSGYPLLLLRPAFYFYISLFLIIAGSIRQRSTNLLALLAPVLMQTLILAVIIFAPSFRYQYGICLIGLFCLGLPFLTKTDE